MAKITFNIVFHDTPPSVKPALSGQSVSAVTPPFPTGDRSIKYRLTVVIEHTVKENLCNTHTIV